MTDTQPHHSLLDASSRVALAALLHDLGKFAERARLPVDQQKLETHKQLYCPQRKAFTDAAGYFTHVHAAYTALAMDAIEPHLPDLTGDAVWPFATWRHRDSDDSLINAAAAHHKPKTFLQWVVAIADRVASGFERESFEAYNQAEEGANHYTARQLTLFEQIRLDEGAAPASKADLAYRYRLAPLSAKALFPIEAKGYEQADKQQAQAEYRQLWEGFIEALQQIPQAHRQSLPLWLDHFETLWGVYTQAIPSATVGKTRPDVSLYDHSRTTAALAVALWRYHHEQERLDAELNREWDEDKFLLIQGDFFGIQDFIFASGGESNKRAAKLLRGRSFYVSLLTECAALKVLEALQLPSTSQVINAAGKFLIVAPNTAGTIERLRQVQAELDEWFLQKSWGQSGIGLAWAAASARDFQSRGEGGKGFQALMKRLFEQLEQAKYQRLELCSAGTPAVFSDYLDAFDNEKGVCAIDGRSPARHPLDGAHYIGDLARDQMACGDYLVKYQRLLITSEPIRHHSLYLSLFGYFVSFAKDTEISGAFDALARNGVLRRAWDFALPANAEQVLWNGYARRNINAYVPRFDEIALKEAQLGRYDKISEPIEPDGLKTFAHLAVDDRQLDANKRWEGEVAIMALKGDIDNLGLMFQRGLGVPSFARMAALSRQVNSFFAVYLPVLCQQESRFRNTYTVFAGGDDFFLIGPWRSTLELARVMRARFTDYVAHNPSVHFSVGLSMTKPGLPITWLASTAEACLEAAKAHNPEQRTSPPKNAVCVFNQTLFWDEYDALSAKVDRLELLRQELGLSTGYVYGLLKLVEMRETQAQKPENAIWKSWFAYRTRRLLERSRGLSEAQRQHRQAELAHDIAIDGIEQHGGRYRIVLFTHLYKHRK